MPDLWWKLPGTLPEQSGASPGPSGCPGPTGVHLLLWAGQPLGLTPPLPAGKEIFPSSSFLFPPLFLFIFPLFPFYFPLNIISLPRLIVPIHCRSSQACLGFLWIAQFSPSQPSPASTNQLTTNFPPIE